VRQLVIKVWNITDARCNHEVYKPITSSVEKTATSAE